MIAIVPWTVDVPMSRWPWANWGLLLVTITISLIVFCDERLHFYLGGVDELSGTPSVADDKRA